MILHTHFILILHSDGQVLSVSPDATSLLCFFCDCSKVISVHTSSCLEFLNLLILVHSFFDRYAAVIQPTQPSLPIFHLHLVADHLHDYTPVMGHTVHFPNPHFASNSINPNMISLNKVSPNGTCPNHLSH